MRYIQLIVVSFSLLSFSAFSQSPKNKILDTELESIIASGEEIFFYLQPYNYDRDNRRDPFAIYSLEVQVSGEKSEDFSENLPLQQYQLSKLKILGIMWNIKKPRVLIADPSGKVHVVVRNDKLGEKKGYLAAIRENEIVIVQTVKKENGKLGYEAKIMNLK